jgi:hypothetical protein
MIPLSTMETERHFLHLIPCPDPDNFPRKTTVGICFGIPQNTFQEGLGLSRYEFGREIGPDTGPLSTIEPTRIVASIFEHISSSHREHFMDFIQAHKELQKNLELLVRTPQTGVSTRETIRMLDNVRLKLKSLVKSLRSSGTHGDEFKRRLISRERAITGQAVPSEGFGHGQEDLVMLQDIIDFMDGLNRVVGQNYIDAQDLDDQLQELRQKMLEMVRKLSDFPSLC